MELYEYHGLSGKIANFLILFIPNKFLPLLSDKVRVFYYLTIWITTTKFMIFQEVYYIVQES